jgi:Bax protein
MIQKIKTVFATLVVVFIVAFSFGIWHTYKQNSIEAAEIETQEVVDALEKIISVTKPDFERENNQTFINSVGECVNYIYNTTTDVIPVNFEILLAQAALESGWGNSRFALEGKNLFGVRTYDLREPHMLPSNNPKKWGVRVYMHECDSVQHYIDIINNGSAYEKYRELRDNDVTDSLQYVETLGAYASDKNYFPKVKSIIKKLRTEYDIPQLN